jgi:hypothetical protein
VTEGGVRGGGAGWVGQHRLHCSMALILVLMGWATQHERQDCQSCGRLAAVHRVNCNHEEMNASQH